MLRELIDKAEQSAAGVTVVPTDLLEAIAHASDDSLYSWALTCERVLGLIRSEIALRVSEPEATAGQRASALWSNTP